MLLYQIISADFPSEYSPSYLFTDLDNVISKFIEDSKQDDNLHLIKYDTENIGLNYSMRPVILVSYYIKGEKYIFTDVRIKKMYKEKYKEFDTQISYIN